MKTTGIILVGYGAIDAKIATEVARVAFPKAIVRSVNTVDDALALEENAGTELLVLPNPTPANVNRTFEATDSAGLPRWAIVVISSNPVPLGVELISPQEWAGPVTSHAFRCAIAQHALRRDLARARGDLLAIGIRVTHEMRTQVASILATAELSKELLEAVEPRQTELYQPIFDSVDMLGALIERVSFVTRASILPAGGKKLKMGDASDGALRRLERTLEQRKVTISQPDSWPEVSGTKPSLEKIWFNLIANALTHGPESTRIDLGWKKDKNEYCFWVRDHGPGVPAEKRDRLFEPFHLLHRKDSPRGMGLAIVRRLSELHGGRCGYAPQRDGGSEFYFTVPV
jgi:signal transduction histidine kinase